jgi:hypothetical protein
MTEGSGRKPVATPGAKMMYLIQRREGVTREELIVHWFANHMPDVIRRQTLQASAGTLAASRYVATLFDPDDTGESPWDGVAQLWFTRPLPRPRRPIGAEPRDSFQQRAEPYMPWATREYVIMDGALPVEPLTLDPPFPCTRSGFHKLTYLLVAQADVDFDDFHAHWLDVHSANVAETMTKTGGFRYVVSLSLEPELEPYAGMAELYFPDASSRRRFQAELPDDGFGQYIARLDTLSAGTEMVGIP